jgi:hypothetical protein
MELFFKFSFIFYDDEGSRGTDNGVKGIATTDRARADGILMRGRVGARGGAELRLGTDGWGFRTIFLHRR